MKSQLFTGGCNIDSQHSLTLVIEAKAKIVYRVQLLGAHAGRRTQQTASYSNP